MRWAGIHWPDGAEPGELWTMPGSTFLLLDSEARWHYDELARRRPESLILWRSIAVPPLTVKMNAGRYCDAVLLHWSEQHNQTDLIPWNEWNLNYERGDSQDDWNRDVMAKVYRDFGATFAGKVRQELRQRLNGSVKLHYPAWAPGHYLEDNVGTWSNEADNWDVIDLHGYGTLADVQAQYAWYRAIFPGKKLCLTEWHGRSRDDVDEERRILVWLADLCRRDPLFIGATFFIWKWHQGKGHVSDWDIEGNPARMALFLSPPVAVDVPPVEPPAPVPEPPPIPPEVPRMATLDDLHRQRWQAIAEVPWNPDSAIYKAWRARPEMGSPLGGEVALADGTVAQAFANGVLRWTGGDQVEVAA